MPEAKAINMTGQGTSKVPAPVMFPSTKNGVRLAIGPASVQSAVLPAGVYRMTATASCFIAIDLDPIASTGATSMPVGAGSPEYIALDGLDRVAVIRELDDGFLYLTPSKLA